MNRPKHNRCDECGRNAHKVAIRRADGIVRGLCPSCLAGPAFGPGADEFANREEQLLSTGTVVYDRRKRKVSR